MALDPEVQKAAENFVAREEGLRFKAYLCVASHLTIGYGHCGTDVLPGMEISFERAKELLTQDVTHAVSVIEHCVTQPRTVGMDIALVSFIHNFGGGKLMSSTMLKLINMGEKEAAAAQFELWDNARIDGKLVEVPALHARRIREKIMFLS